MLTAKSEYEIQRERNLKRNAAVLRELGLDDGGDAVIKKKVKKRRTSTTKPKKKIATKPTRRSTRNRKAPAPPLYVPESLVTSTHRYVVDQIEAQVQRRSIRRGSGRQGGTCVRRRRLSTSR